MTIVEIETETTLHRTFRLIIGILLSIQTLALFVISCLALFIVPLIGGLAYVAGAGNASDENIHKAWWMLGLMTFSPFVVTILLAIASVLIIKYKRSVFASVVCGLTVVIYIYLVHVALVGHWSQFRIAGVVPILLPFAGAVVSVK